jgi:hypothetical protein
VFQWFLLNHNRPNIGCRRGLWSKIIWSKQQ